MKPEYLLKVFTHSIQLKFDLKTIFSKFVQIIEI